jgi:hypothetical protein
MLARFRAAVQRRPAFFSPLLPIYFRAGGQTLIPY